MHLSRRISHAACVAVSLTACAGMLGMGPKISREGDGAHREKMSALEASPVPAAVVEAIASAQVWVNDPVSTEVFTEGGVVALAFVDSSNRVSMTMLNSFARLMRQRGEDGLTILAVHPAEGWDTIEQLHSDGRIRVPIVRDDGAIAEALGVDDDPDVYLIDRAGLLRYADIHSRSVDIAIASLIRETPERAASNAAKESQARAIAMEEDGSAEERESKTTTGSTKAKPADYAKADWPDHNRGELYASNFQGRSLPVRLGGEQWVGRQRDLSEKVIVLDFWATWCGPCIRAMPMLDQLQSSNPNDLAILGVGGQSEDLETVRRYVERSSHTYGQLFDARQRIYKALGVRAIPHVVVLSTDGVIRWQGNPLSGDFSKAVEQVLSVDPGISRNQRDD